MKWLKSFFATDNSVNENTVMGTIFSACLIVSTFTSAVEDEKYYILAGLVALFFGIGVFKK